MENKRAFDKKNYWRFAAEGERVRAQRLSPPFLSESHSSLPYSQSQVASHANRQRYQVYPNRQRGNCVNTARETNKPSYENYSIQPFYGSQQQYYHEHREPIHQYHRNSYDGSRYTSNYQHLPRFRFSQVSSFDYRFGSENPLTKPSGNLQNSRMETKRSNGKRRYDNKHGYRLTQTHRHKSGRKIYSCSPPSICHKLDYDMDSEWLEIQLRSHLERNPENNFIISLTEPVITHCTPSSQAVPHYHISQPFYSDPSQVGRQMIPVKLPEEISQMKTSFDFTVLSYNVLADKLLNDNKRLYAGYADWVLDWEYRKDNLMKEIITYNADVICLQEVQREHMTGFFLPILKENGYIGLYKQRTCGKPDGCAIFYRENRFEYLGCRFVEFRKHGHNVMNRDNVAVIVALQPKDTENKPPLLIANTHLLFNKNRGDIKLLQLATLLAEMDEMARVFSDLPTKSPKGDVHNPVIICGDFNSAPFSPVYDFIVNGQLKYDGMSRVHLSGQNLPNKKKKQNSYLNSALIPSDLGITDLCQKKDKDAECQRESRKPLEDCENEECVIVGEKVNGKNEVLEEPGVLKHLMDLQSVYSHSLKDGRQEVSTCHMEGCLCVDYIFFSQGVQRTISEHVNEDKDIIIETPRKQLYLTQMLSLLGSDEVVEMGKLPNICLSSDHLALLACFKLVD